MKTYPALLLYSGSRIFGNLVKQHFDDIIKFRSLGMDDSSKHHDKIVLFMEYVGNHTQTLELIAETLPNVKANEFYIVIDDCYEGLIDNEFIEKFTDLCKNNKKITDYMILSSNKKLQEKVEKGKFHYLNIHLHLPVYDGIETQFLNHTINKKLRSKKFLCVNRQEGVHRLRTIDYLIEKDILKHTHASCFLGEYSALLDNKNFTQNPSVEKYQDEDLRRTVLTKESKERLKKHLPLILDVQEHQYKAFACHLPALENYFDDSYWSIVTEGDFAAKDQIQFTEKVVKCFAYHHPFIVIGLPNTLQTLREHGFFTFDSIIDESYDKELNNDKRLQMALEQVNKLNQLNLQEMKRLYQDITPILEHNYRRYTELYNQAEPMFLVSRLLYWFHQN